MTVFIVPGLDGSGESHWQTRWETILPACARVPLGDWTDPTRDGWIAQLDEAVRAARDEVVLVAHSLGCLAVAWWAAVAPDRARRVASAMLVAPPDADRPDADARIRRFAPVPRRPLPFAALVVASSDDPYASIERSAAMARDWSAGLHRAGLAGHINASSGLGDWPEGRRVLEGLVGGGDAPGGAGSQGAPR